MSRRSESFAGLGYICRFSKLFHVEQFGVNGNGLGELCCKWLCFVRDAVALNYGLLCLGAANGDFWR